MDPSQKAAEPLQPVSTGELIRRMNPESEPQDSPEAQDNRQNAASEITMIFELKELAAFKWFESEFIDKAYSAAFEMLRNPKSQSWKDDGEVTLEEIQAVYVALRKVKVGMIEREIAHRELLDPNDAEILRLREKLSTL